MSTVSPTTMPPLLVPTVPGLQRQETATTPSALAHPDRLRRGGDGAAALDRAGSVERLWAMFEGSDGSSQLHANARYKELEGELRPPANSTI